MSRAITWTSGMDATLQAMRREGRTCHQIAAALKLSKNAIINRCDRLGMVTGFRFRVAVRMDALRAGGDVLQNALQAEERDENPLRAGHPIAWAIIGRGEPWPGHGIEHARI